MTDTLINEDTEKAQRLFVAMLSTVLEGIENERPKHVQPEPKADTVKKPKRKIGKRKMTLETVRDIVSQVKVGDTLKIRFKPDCTVAAMFELRDALSYEGVIAEARQALTIRAIAAAGHFNNES